MDHGALDNPLEPRRRFGVLAIIDNQVGQFRVDIGDKVRAQLVEINRTGAHHGGCILIIDQGQQEMFKRGVFVPALIGQGQGAMETFLEAAGKNLATHLTPCRSQPQQYDTAY